MQSFINSIFMLHLQTLFHFIRKVNNINFNNLERNHEWHCEEEFLGKYSFS